MAGDVANFSAAAVGATGFRWQRSTNAGVTFVDISGATNANYTTPTTVLADNGTRYRVVVSGAANSATSAAAILTVMSAPVAPAISVPPANQSITAGQNASFSVTATGTSLAYRWQESTDGGASFSNIAAPSNTTTISLTAVPLAASGRQYRVIVSNTLGSITSSAATLTVAQTPVAPAISVHPANQSIAVGQNVSFSVTATGTSLAYQWQESTNGGATFSNIAAPSNTTTISLAAVPLAGNARQYRVIVSNALGSITSSTATLTVTTTPVTPAISMHPANQSITAGQNASFSVTATGSSLTYQWQESTNGGSTFSDIPAPNNATTITLTAVALASNGRQFRVIVSNTLGSITSSAAMLTVTPVPLAPSIIIQPADRSVVAPNAATFGVAVGGTLPITLQWQVSTNGGATFANIAGATGATYTTPATVVGDSGKLYRAVATNATGVATSSPAKLTVTLLGAPSITNHPSSMTVTAPSTATFSAIATGTPAPALQWQLSTDDGTTFTNIVGATASRYTTPATLLADSGKQFRVVATSTTGTATSNPATLTVIATSLPDLVLSSYRPVSAVQAGENAVFSVTVRNQGSAPTSQSVDLAVDLFLSGSPMGTPQIFPTAVGPLAIGESVTLSFSANFSATTPVGSNYTSRLRVDASDAVTEMHKDNNASAHIPFAVVNSPLPNLTFAVAPSLSAATVASGNAVNVGVSVRNIGSQTTGSGFRVGVHLSNSAVVRASDTLLCTASVAPLAPAQTASVTLACPLPIPAGTYYLAAIIDDLSEIGEPNEADNISGSASITVQ